MKSVRFRLLLLALIALSCLHGSVDARRFRQRTRNTTATTTRVSLDRDDAAKEPRKRLMEHSHSHSYPNFKYAFRTAMPYSSTLATTTSTTLSPRLSLLAFRRKNQTARIGHYKDTFYSAGTSSDCQSFFRDCLCAFHQDTRRHFLYCNDPVTKEMPDFKTIYAQWDSTSRGPLIFSRIDLSGSEITRIEKDDLKYLQLDIVNVRPSAGDGDATSSHKNNSVDYFLDHLKSAMVPMYHLDFDNIVDISDYAFEELSQSAAKLGEQLISQAQIDPNTPKKTRDDLVFLKIRFRNSQLNFAPNRRPFKGLRALHFHLTNMSAEYLANSIFDDSVISELSLDQGTNFVGFVDQGAHLPTGRLLHRFIALRSYKIDALCSHSLPSFVDPESFNEIVIRKCGMLRSITAFTFYKFPHLKILTLSSNNLTTLDKDSFRYLTQLETLDLSFNPLAIIEDYTFRDLSSLKVLYLEATSLKRIERNAFIGLYLLTEVVFARSTQLAYIHGRAFEDARKSLREINLKDTLVSFLDPLRNDGTHPPYLRYIYETTTTTDAPQLSDHVWLDGLVNLTLLNLDSQLNSDQLAAWSPNDERLLLCKLLRYVSPSTLINLQRNAPCNCLVYMLYTAKSFISRWEYKAPFCYRTQIGTDRSFASIAQHEATCELAQLPEVCFPIVTTTTTTTTTTTITTTARRTRPPRRTKPPRQNPDPGTEVISESKVRKFPKLDVVKLMKVIATIIAISVLAILIMILITRIMIGLEKRKKELKANSIRQRTSSNSSSVQASLNAVPATTSAAVVNRGLKTLVMPPSVIPNFNSRLTAMQGSKRIITSATDPQFAHFRIEGNKQNANATAETRRLLMNKRTDQDFSMDEGKAATFSIHSND